MQDETALYGAKMMPNEGDRLVSDTLFVELPKNLPDIEIKP